MNSIIEKLHARFWSRVHKTDTCWLWTGGKYPFGYGYLKCRPLQKSAFEVHRLSWEIHNGPIPDGLWVLHKCDVPECVNPDHLFLGTNLDNIADMHSKNRGAHGTAMPQAKLTWEKVQEIRRLFDRKKRNASALGRQFGVSRKAIDHVVEGRNWKQP